MISRHVLYAIHARVFSTKKYPPEHAFPEEFLHKMLLRQKVTNNYSVCLELTKVSEHRPKGMIKE